MSNMKILITIIYLSASPVLIFGQSGECKDCRRTAIFDQTTLIDPMVIVNPEGFRSSVLARLAEMMTQPCFHFSNKGLLESEMKKAEKEQNKPLCGI